MINRDSPGFDELVRIFLIANTPGFLFRRFRASAFVQALGSSSPTGDLAAEVVQFVALESPTLKDIVACYAAAAALASKTPTDVKAVINSLPAPRDSSLPDPWLYELLRLGVTGRSSTSEAFVEIPIAQPKIISHIQSENTTSMIGSQLPCPEPRIERNHKTSIALTAQNEVRIDHD